MQKFIFDEMLEFSTLRGNIANFLVAFVIFACVGTATAQVAPIVSEEEVVIMNIDIEKVIQDIMASSTVSRSEAVVLYENKTQNDRVVESLYRIEMLLMRINKSLNE